MKKVTFLSIGLFLLLTVLSSCNIAKFFQQKYYKDSYEPVSITKVDNAIPVAHKIEGITCYSYANPYCQSASMQMIHSLDNNEQDIHFYNWIMGFTYGAYFHNYVGIQSFLPSNDPELGYIQAAEMMGYDRKYYITDKFDDYKQFIKQQLSDNVPIRVSVNSATMVNEEGFYPHSILLVGYNAENVIYYETGESDRKIENHEGETMDWNTLKASVESIADGFNYPWIYQLTLIKSQNTNINTDINDSRLIAANKSSVLGNTYGPVHIGANAFTALANYIDKNGISADEKDYLELVVEMAAENRLDNANFLKNTEISSFVNAANYFTASSKLLKDLLNELNQEKTNLQTVSNLLVSISEQEQLVANAFTETP